MLRTIKKTNFIIFKNGRINFINLITFRNKKFYKIYS